VLVQASVSNADLRAADLRKACLGNADLRGANLSSANLEGADLSSVREDETTIWPDGFDADRRRDAGVIADGPAAPTASEADANSQA
jgi:Pentapeptide repeats (8 copies)